MKYSKDEKKKEQLEFGSNTDDDTDEFDLFYEKCAMDDNELNICLLYVL